MSLLSKYFIVSAIFVITRYILTREDMLLYYHQLEILYHFHYDFSLPLIAFDSVNFMVIASIADLLFCYGLVCYIVNIIIKNHEMLAL